MVMRGGVTKTNISLLREANKQVKRHFSKLMGGESMAAISNKGHEKAADGLSYWVPHPRTGIYVPQGHESVIDDVPDSAASFNQTYWLREVDGVEKLDPDILFERHFRNK
ncbi:hypothetical protein FEM48_Zijuj09G0132300 [Ziziphus jujuba var. spinosa]|uniref:Uncharacterized protein n=1 Tax=Ziziphus jujuba var. spinosa TaxID=714518 RepID=A0A978UT76_ZIZJJ|nr:hypothetical protein FEM48_Zijuj09G0132300 [Ziziphus jujuba var. spinosa]